MTIVKGYFDELHFPESNIENFEFVDKDLIVNIKSGLEIYGSHPLSSTHKFREPCRLIFKNVLLSKCSLSFYTQDFTSFTGEDQLIEKKLDGENESSIKYEEYCIEGVLQNPKAWVTWDLVAEEFYLDDLK